MALSIWEYLRARTRDAVLSGFQDAMDVVEQGDTNGSQHLAANQLAARLSPPDTKTLPGPSVGREPSANGNGAQSASELLTAPTRPTAPVVFDDELERRLEAAVPQNGQEALAADAQPAGPAPGRITDRKRRGRPPKNKQDGK